MDTCNSPKYKTKSNKYKVETFVEHNSVAELLQQKIKNNKKIKKF